MRNGLKVAEKLIPLTNMIGDNCDLQLLISKSYYGPSKI